MKKNSIFTHRWASIEIRKLHAGWHRQHAKVDWILVKTYAIWRARVLATKIRFTLESTKCNDPRRSDHYGSSLSCFIKSSFAFPADGFPKIKNNIRPLIEKAFSINGIFYAYHCERLAINHRKAKGECEHVCASEPGNSVKLLCLFIFMLRLNVRS